MMLNDMVLGFMDSRKRGTTGARKKCRPKSLTRYSITLGYFIEFIQTECGVLEYQNIKRPHMIQFLEWLDWKEKRKEWSRATVLQVLRTLRAFFNWVERDEDCQEEQLRNLKKYLPPIERTPRRVDIPKRMDVNRFKGAFNTKNPYFYRDYIVTCLLLTNGMRIGEVCSLTLDSILWDQKILIAEGKTGKRPVPLTDDMIRLLKAWLKRRMLCKSAQDSPYVFVSRRGPQMTQAGFTKSFAKHCKKFGLPRITPHSFRHYFCSQYLTKGGDIEKLRNITGHSSYDVLKGYLHLAEMGNKETQEELERVNLLREA